MNRSISIQSLARINLLQFHKRTKSTQINNTKKVKLSIVDISPVTEGSTRGEAINNTLQLAQLADSLGYGITSWFLFLYHFIIFFIYLFYYLFLLFYFYVNIII